MRHTANSEITSYYPEVMNFGPVHVPAGKLFVLGDNRENSYDSRIPGYGFVDVQAVIGKPLYITATPYAGRRGKTLN